ncbi:MAG: colicin D domain-containing protein [Hafnia alvei]|nr:colicin D domain-containing protein [Hafnia alvei]
MMNSGQAATTLGKFMEQNGASAAEIVQAQSDLAKGVGKQYETAIKNHLNDKSTSENGTYGFVKDSRVFFNPNTNNVVVIDKQVSLLQASKLFLKRRSMITT